MRRSDLKDLLLLPRERPSISETRASVSFCSSDSARCSSSDPTSPSAFSSRRSCITSRRTLRTEIAALLGDAVHDLHEVLAPLLGQLRYLGPDRLPSLRRASSPTSDSRIAFSIALIDRLVVRRDGEQARLGGRDLASCFSGVRRRSSPPARGRAGAGDARPVRTVENSPRVASTDFVIVPSASSRSPSISAVAHVVTSVPTRSPHTIRSIFRSSSMLKT